MASLISYKLKREGVVVITPLPEVHGCVIIDCPEPMLIVVSSHDSRGSLLTALESALDELVEAALNRRANAVVGVTVSFDLRPDANTVVAMGAAVVLAPPRYAKDSPGQTKT